MSDESRSASRARRGGVRRAASGSLFRSSEERDVLQSHRPEAFVEQDPTVQYETDSVAAIRGDLAGSGGGGASDGSADRTGVAVRASSAADDDQWRSASSGGGSIQEQTIR